MSYAVKAEAVYADLEIEVLDAPFMWTYVVMRNGNGYTDLYDHLGQPLAHVQSIDTSVKMWATSEYRWSMTLQEFLDAMRP